MYLYMALPNNAQCRGTILAAKEVCRCAQEVSSHKALTSLRLVAFYLS